MPVYVTNYSTQSVSMRVVKTSDLVGTYANGNGGFNATLTAPGNGALMIDSVSVVANDFVLLQDQTDNTQNGPYVVTDPGDGSNPWILTRADFFMTPQIASAGTFLPVGAGTVEGGTLWVLIEPIPTSIGSDPIYFVKV